MTETAETPQEKKGSRASRASGGLSSKLLPELKQIAGGLGIKGVSGMKKAQLVEAIRAAQSGPGPSGSNGAQPDRRDRDSSEGSADVGPKDSGRTDSGRTDSGRTDSGRTDERPAREDQHRRDPQEGSEQATSEGGRSGQDRSSGTTQDRRGGRDQDRRDDRSERSRNQSDQNQNKQNNQNQGNQNQGSSSLNQNQGRNDDDGGGGNNRRRRRRGRDRDRPGQGQSAGQGYRDRRQSQDVDVEVTEDDVLVPVAGILDILDNYAFVRTSGYLPGPNDVYVSLSMVRKHGLRKGDAITGEVRQPREGERKEKFNPLVRIETVNGGDIDAARTRVEFSKLTPLYASERLRLETDHANMIGRVIDIAAPIGKGQRGLIVSPPKAGKTMIMQSIANSITSNNPECHLMIVLVDERPEEVTDFQRTVKGEVIASTFDRPASDHTTVAELAIERAKRLVELGHDVVVLLDGITRLGRAYNLAAPASGRILSGGVDSSALYPPKRFFGAARNIEDGGSLTILSTALVETGSKMDEVIFEEFKGTGNMELRLRRDFADKRLFPAIDAVQSGTRREELLMSKEELSIVWKLRRVLSGLDGQQALELLLERLRKTHSNIDFLMQVQKTTPGVNGD